ncbi:hypothetical protein SAMN02787142_0561 [Burkholderia sp. WP9]|uniref:hypothetical protein n=1 Tax=Burkholderia sp. WP9 TaxID=1500263 RepID=UPI00089AFBDE|nr:hypothetical protein [Burkholderia sp. WP9]SEB91809.1 hypothetical protein SAMN02787142_0561 [Burkholderia sp. WP9]
MNALSRNAVAMATAMCRDAYGNKMSGQDARSLGFMAAAIKLLTAVSEHAEAKGDVRAEAALKAVMTEAFNETESLPVFDPALVAEGTARYQKMGLSPAGVLNSVDASELEAS